MTEAALPANANLSTAVALRSASSSAASATAVEIDGRRVMLVRTGGQVDPVTGLAPALAPADAAVLEAAFRTAREKRLPIVGLIAASGVSATHGMESVVGWGRAARELVKSSGVVPILLTASGPVVSGPALLLGLADVTVFTSDAYAFVSGPHMVESFTGVPVTATTLGGSSAHARSSGVASLLADDEESAVDLMMAVLSHLPDHVDDLPPRIDSDDPVDRATDDAAQVMPSHPTGSYDVRTVIRDLADDAEFLELRAAWAPNLVTGLCSIGGLSIGVVANQTQALAGSIDIPASQKGARFVAMCDAFNIPLLTLVDTSGFLPGKDLEWRGMIRHGAQLAFAYARATVPRIGLTLRKSYGGAYIVMDSRFMGNDLMLAWPSAEVAVMGAKGAVEILHRNISIEERAELEQSYEERYLTPYPTAERGSISAVIEPTDTRRELAAGFDMLITKRESLRPRRHDNTPL
ncbi:MAG: acetyl-CoA carboxylase carboxyltransferase component [Acidimicrobiales bacterium]